MKLKDYFILLSFLFRIESVWQSREDGKGLGRDKYLAREAKGVNLAMAMAQEQVGHAVCYRRLLLQAQGMSLLSLTVQGFVVTFYHNSIKKKKQPTNVHSLCMDQGLNFLYYFKSNSFPTPYTTKNPWLSVKPRKIT